MAKKVDCSLIILSYNTRELLKDTLQTIEKARKKTHYNLEVIVVDNGSKDESCHLVRQKFPAVKLYVLNQNYGFSRGNNVGIGHSQGRYILLLNSDVVVLPNTLEVMLTFMDNNPRIGVATCKLIFPNGQLDPACHRGFPTPWVAFTYFAGLEKLLPHHQWFSAYHLGHLPVNLIHEIDSPSGAFYMVRREVVNEVGLLDEDYFMYGEDLDWSYRIKEAGWKIMYVPITTATHYKKQSGRASKDIEARRQATAAFYDTMKIFYRKHYASRYPKLLMWLIFGLIDLVKKIALRRPGGIQSLVTSEVRTQSS